MFVSALLVRAGPFAERGGTSCSIDENVRLDAHTMESRTDHSSETTNSDAGRLAAWIRLFASSELEN